MADLETFRAETRAWLEANCPASMRTPTVEEEVVWGGRGQKFVNPDSKVWLDRMVAKGWTAPSWAHAPLIMDAEGRRLAKRTAGLSIRELRAAGRSPAEVLHAPLAALS